MTVPEPPDPSYTQCHPDKEVERSYSKQEVFQPAQGQAGHPRRHQQDQHNGETSLYLGGKPCRSQILDERKSTFYLSDDGEDTRQPETKGSEETPLAAQDM